MKKNKNIQHLQTENVTNDGLLGKKKLVAGLKLMKGSQVNFARALI